MPPSAPAPATPARPKKARLTVFTALLVVRWRLAARAGTSPYSLPCVQQVSRGQSCRYLRPEKEFISGLDGFGFAGCGVFVHEVGNARPALFGVARLEAVKLGKLGEQIRRPGLKLARVFA
jgi:hypothetical protein